MCTPAFDFESALLGCIAADESVYARVASLVSSEDIHNGLNQRIFAAAEQLHHEGRPVDPLLLLQRVGAEHTDYLCQLIDMTPTVHNAEIYATEVHRMAIVAKIKAASIALAAAGTTSEINERLAAVLALHDTMTTSGVGAKIVSSVDAMAPYLNSESTLVAGTKKVVPTGIRTIDELLGGGLLSGAVYILGARTGVGKTSLALAIATAVAKRGDNVMYVSLEMGAREIGAKRLAGITEIDSGRILTGQLTPEEHDRVTAVAMDAAEQPLYLMDDMSANIGDVRAAAKSIRGLSLLVIDYIGLLAGDRRTTRYEAVTELSRQIKVLAHDLGVPILALSQLRRECEDGYDSPPKLTDLRDSGALEQDADGVILLWRGRHRRVDPSDPIEIKLSVAKNRHGSVGTGTLAFRPETSKFYCVRYESKDHQ